MSRHDPRNLNRPIVPCDEESSLCVFCVFLMKLATAPSSNLQHFPYSFTIPIDLPNLVRCHHLACKDNRNCRSRQVVMR
jgi:hypothetical protein